MAGAPKRQGRTRRKPETVKEEVADQNKEAVETAIQVALMLKAKVVDEIQIMRKTVNRNKYINCFIK